MKKGLERFIEKTKAVRFPHYVQFTALTSRRKQIGCTYHVYVCIDTLEVINPYTKKHQGRKYKCFSSSVSSEEAKTKAFEYIQQFNH